LAIDVIERGGFKAYVVGGCVRDSLLGKEPKDWDIATDAVPAETAGLFSKYKLLTHGEKYGTMTVLFNGTPVEVTTYRSDGVYSDKRRPDSVNFTSDIRDDLSRRDFTINAIAYGRREGLTDPFGGAADVAGGVVRCVGDAYARFGEDALRILRALRLAARLAFVIEPRTSLAIRDLRGSLGHISRERVRAELSGILSAGDGVLKILYGYQDVFITLIPELDVGAARWRRAAGAAALAPPELAPRLALLLSVAQKTGAARKSDAVQKILQRLRFDNATIEDVAVLVRLICDGDENLPSDKTAVKRLLNDAGERRFHFLTQAVRALAEYDGRADRVKAAEAAVRAADIIIKNNECYRIKDLNVNGDDLIAAGFKPGRALGSALSALLEMVVTGECANERPALLYRAGRLLNDRDRCSDTI